MDQVIIHLILIYFHFDWLFSFLFENSTLLKLCKTGYRGALCMSCDRTFASFSFGQCEQCASIFRSILNLLVFVLILIAIINGIGMINYKSTLRKLQSKLFFCLFYCNCLILSHFSKANSLLKWEFYQLVALPIPLILLFTLSLSSPQRS